MPTYVLVVTHSDSFSFRSFLLRDIRGQGLGMNVQIGRGPFERWWFACAIMIDDQLRRKSDCGRVGGEASHDGKMR